MSLQKIQNELSEIDFSNEKIIDWILKEAKSIYRSREELIPEDIIRGFERFITLRTIISLGY